jgi:adhesin transport system outer membrane protein
VLPDPNLPSATLLPEVAVTKVDAGEASVNAAPSPAEPVATLPVLPVENAPKVPVKAPPPAALAAEPSSPPQAVSPVSVPKRAKKENSVPVVSAKPAVETAENTSDIAWRDGRFVRSLQHYETVVTLPVGEDNKPDMMDPLRIDEAVALTLRNNDAVKAAGESVTASYWEKLASYALYAPTVEARYATGREQSMPASYNDATGTRVADDTHSRHDTLFSVRQPIIDASIINDIMLKKTREDFADDTARDVREGLAFDTVNAYLRLIQSSLAIKLAGEYRDYLHRLETRMQARVEGGGATPGDLARIRGRLTNADSARIEAEGQFQNDLAEFKRLTHVTPSRLAIPDALAPSLPQSMHDAIEHALVENPAYRATLRKVDLARKTRDHSYAVLAPTLGVEYNHNDSYNAGGAAKGNPVDGLYPSQKDNRLMLVAHWSLSGGYDVLNGMAGEKRVSQAGFEASDSRLQLEQAVQASYTAVNAANARIDVVRNGVDANSKVVHEFEDQQDNGHRSLFDLLDAYEQLYNSRISLMRMVVTRATSSYLVHRQMGTLLPALEEASAKIAPQLGKGE